MLIRRTATVLMAALLLLAPLTAAYAQADDKDVHDRDEVQPYGTGICIRPALVVGSILIAGNRCYNFYLFRNIMGTYLALGPGGQLLVQPGQVIYINTAAGAGILNRLINFIPLNIHLNVPIGTIQFTPVHVRMQGSQVILGVSRGPQRTDVALERR